MKKKNLTKTTVYQNKRCGEELVSLYHGALGK